MGTVKQADTPLTAIGDKRTRYLSKLDNLMMAVIDFHDGPTEQPDEPHWHPHEQICNVAELDLVDAGTPGAQLVVVLDEPGKLSMRHALIPGNTLSHNQHISIGRYIA
jgi:hypothetical protein